MIEYEQLAISVGGSQLVKSWKPLWSAIEQNDSRFSIIFISYFYEKDGGRWETYCLYGVEGDGILSIL